MNKRITVTLTEDQARLIDKALAHYFYSLEYKDSMQKPYIKRLGKSIRNALKTE